MSDIYKLTEGFDITSIPKFTKDGHTMFLSDVEKDLNYWRNKTLELQAENAELKKRSESLKLNLGLCCNHLLLALNLDEIEDEEDRASIHAKANDFIVSCSETLRGV